MSFLSPTTRKIFGAGAICRKRRIAPNRSGGGRTPPQRAWKPIGSCPTRSVSIERLPTSSICSPLFTAYSAHGVAEPCASCRKAPDIETTSLERTGRATLLPPMGTRKRGIPIRAPRAQVSHHLVCPGLAVSLPGFECLESSPRTARPGAVTARPSVGRVCTCYFRNSLNRQLRPTVSVFRRSSQSRRLPRRLSDGGRNGHHARKAGRSGALVSFCVARRPLHFAYSCATSTG